MALRDLVAEHAGLTAERKEIALMLANEFASMSVQTARAREARIHQIDNRLASIERSRQWKERISG